MTVTDPSLWLDEIVGSVVEEVQIATAFLCLSWLIIQLQQTYLDYEKCTYQGDVHPAQVLSESSQDIDILHGHGCPSLRSSL